MRKHLKTLALVMAFTSALGGAAQGQQQPPAQAPGGATSRPPAALTSLKVQIVVSRYQGDRKVSSLPYSIWVNADGAKGSLRMGAQVPVLSQNIGPVVDGKPAPAMASVQYRNIGTNIDCSATSTDDGRFKVNVTVDDNSIYADGQTAQGATRLNDVPTFRNFTATTVLVLKDGQSGEFMAATDKVSGETTKVEVTIAIVK